MFINETSESVNNQKIVAAIDYDGIIQEICFPWIENILENTDYFKDYIDFSKLDDIEKILNIVFNRTKYLLYNSIRLENAPKPSEQFMKDFNSLYRDDPELYLKAPYLSGLQLIWPLIKQRNTENITILSHCDNENTFNQKKEKVEKLFNGNEIVNFVGLSSNISKADWLNSNLPNWNLFIDDYPKNIKEVLDKCNCTHKTILIPKYGYLTNNIKNLIEETALIKNAEIGYYQPQFISTTNY